MERFIHKIRKHIKNEHFEEALRLIESKERENILCPELLILKARILQLCDIGDYSISDIEQIYKKAILIDDNYISSFIELGYFYYAVMDNSELAETYFKTAFKKCKKQMTETVIGLAKSIGEKSKEDALKLMENAYSQTLEKRKINNLKKEFKI